MSRVRETDLYPPVKAFLKAQGYEVKGEVANADVVGCREGDDPVIVELKTGFSLSLLQQGVARQAVTDAVYVCVPRNSGRAAYRALAENIKLCRRLGLGVLTVRLTDGLVEVHCDPGPYRPRKVARRKSRLLREFARRQGDPNDGGATRHGLVTSYRQDALRCATYLAEYGASRGAAVKRDTGVAAATRIMADDHYGWFTRIERGVFALTDQGRRGLADWVDALEEADQPATRSK
ncbi:MAG: DUF2161 family putative PD-(D/E)XK-type phosphodiesterase [Rhodobacter sp.]|nr:DUF2161 family putative PD-(D/E)XK-type phosphodiesterase [Rhodobacter sp.]